MEMHSAASVRVCLCTDIWVTHLQGDRHVKDGDVMFATFARQVLALVSEMNAHHVWP